MAHRLYNRRRVVVAGLAALGGLGAGLPMTLHAQSSAPVALSAGRDRATARWLAEATRAFGFNLFGQLTVSHPADNTFISPLSVALALAMTYDGAAGATQQAMAAALSLGNRSAQDVNSANATLLAYLRGRAAHVELTIADSLWARMGITFQAAFMDDARRFYDAEVATLDFRDPGAPARINAWVAARTQGKIPSIVADRIDPHTVLFLINAIYFKGAWTVPFDTKRTTRRPFTLAGGAHKSVQMMAQSGRYRYYDDGTFQAIRLPYGNGALSMYVFLPAAGAGLTGFLARLNAQTWQQWTARMVDAQGTIMLPRFSADYAVGLKDALTNLGMGVAFDRQRADFGRMVALGLNQRAYIQDVRHRAVVQVDEHGTTAAGATSVSVGIMAAIPSRPPFTMIVDRPFFCAIADDATGVPLFMGAIANPI